MKSNTRLDSIVFQLTPTRTRCDLVITANGKSEKIASGLLNPFLAHLKTAQDQIEKGGYSVVLEPNRGSEAAWFTKGTVERFVRFVSTPEILERVYTIESEIVQIEKAICSQNNCETGSDTVEDLPVKSEESIEGSKAALGGSEEKAIVLYQPVSHQQEDDGSAMQEKNSKVQLVRVLETRQTVLQKEQGMAFARAVAAGFDIDNISALLSFAESFGASRMMDACKRFVELWKAKHESGQWVEVEAIEATSCRSDLHSMNGSGIMFLSSNEQGEVASETTGLSCATGADVKLQADHQGQHNPHEYMPAQYPHPMFPPWQMHPQANGLPAFQPYPMQGMPYYQNYPNSPFFQPPYPPQDDSRLHSGQKTRQRRHSMDSRDLSADSETQEIDASRRRMQDDEDMDEEDPVCRRTRKKGGRSSRKQSGTVVIRNINYIASAKEGSLDSHSESCSDSGTDEEEGNVRSDEVKKMKKKGVYPKSDDALKASHREERMSGQAGDDGHWQAFQNFLLNDADESNSSAMSNMVAMEGKVQGRKRQTAIGDASSNLGYSECPDSQDDLKLIEAGGRRGGNRRARDSSMDYMINRQEKLTEVWDSSLDPVIANGLQGSSDNKSRGASHGMVDESVMILQRSGSLDQVTGDGRTAMDMDYELPSVSSKAENHTVGTRNQSNYEPNLMPDRVMEDGPSVYNPALDYEMQAQVKETVNPSGKKEVTTGVKEGSRKGIKDQKLKTEKRIAAGMRREKPSKLSPSEDARARAERLRAFKAELQKQKKEKEEEQMKRLEALKIQRQKRIAAKSGVNPAQSTLPLQQAMKKLPKLSPVSQKGSKFSDTEPGSSSPLQRSTLKTVSRVSSDSDKATKSGKLTYGSPASGNRLTRSASTISVRKEENSGITPDPKVRMARFRRLSEPKGTVHLSSSGKTRSAEAASRSRVSEGPEIKRMPATPNPDKAKSAALPELKLKATKGSSVSTQKKTTTKQILQKPEDKMLSSAPASANLSKGSANISPASDGDDSTVVEKTVVMLECEKPSIAILHASEDKMGIANIQSNGYNPSGKSEDVVAIPSPASPITVKEVDREPSADQVKRECDTHLNETAGAAYTEKVLPHVGTTGRPPHARVSSLEDPCMVRSNYGKAPPTSLEMEAAREDTTNVHVSDQRQDIVKISDITSGKHQGKESSKGFRRFLKFGKKSSAASESNADSDKGSLDGSVADDNALNGSSSEVFTLKNLLIQEESSNAATTPKKSSRSFSLLSPFKSKNSEKKLST